MTLVAQNHRKEGYVLSQISLSGEVSNHCEEMKFHVQAHQFALFLVESTRSSSFCNQSLINGVNQTKETKPFIQAKANFLIQDQAIPSFASLLTRQSQSLSYGHGWLMGKDGKRWHPSRDQSALLSELHSKARRPFTARFFKFFWRRYEKQYYRAN